MSPIPDCLTYTTRRIHMKDEHNFTMDGEGFNDQGFPGEGFRTDGNGFSENGEGWFE